ncbi:decarboxylating 6-phosphogluconate dehydrogenase [Luteibacter pinisoli]|jgi:6-phosphogluconate dehydrogenase|uniref:Decarboxylating 6-phosphogluconate dehydrogenase n=1 Tax=Luteibacter pinisoli TaxID=2589080 RepID=A0A4Y5Z1T0_9GAMM|nr:decarboxylating 6-phosphogluconate dehydrogenase [Luteibacter pinisoli]QDE39171.1 decarboxylating 6-phosphogluconate dehydrogenase [Luteibacter pinisoli]
MKIGLIGLGRMGGNIARRLMRDGHETVVYDVSADARATLAKDGSQAVDSVEALVQALPSPKAVWVMLPAGEITEATVQQLAGLMGKDDIIIDGGNTFYKDDARRGKELAQKGIHYVDVGTSGGVWGLDRGYCMMIGGDKPTVDHLDPIFKTLAPGAGDIPRTEDRDGRDPRVEQGYMHAGPAGAGHFVKMIHNGIEYGMMQSFAEGFDILKNRNADFLPEHERYDLDMADIAEVWRRGSVVSSWLLDLTASALAKGSELDNYSGYVNDSGEGRWTVNAAIEEAVPAEVLTSALFARFRSRQDHTYAERLLSAMRMGFGGHVEGRGKPPKEGEHS